MEEELFEKICKKNNITETTINSLKIIFSNLFSNDDLFYDFLFNFNEDEYSEIIKNLKVLLEDYKSFLENFMLECQRNVQEFLVSQGINNNIVKEIVQNRIYNDPLLDVINNLNRNPYYINE